MCRALPGPDPIPKQEMACVAPLSWHRKVKGLTQGHIAGAFQGAGRDGVGRLELELGPRTTCCLSWRCLPGACLVSVPRGPERTGAHFTLASADVRSLPELGSA